MHDDRPENTVARIGDGKGHTNPRKWLYLLLHRSKWFHVWCLPLIWALPVSILYCLLWNKGEAGMAAMFAGAAGLWAPGLLHAEGIAFVIVQLAAGAIVMACVGFLQDLLRLRWWIYLLYGVGTVAAWYHQTLTHSEPTRTEITSVVFFLCLFCFTLYFIAPASCVVGALVHVVRAVRARMTGLHFILYFLLPTAAVIALVLGVTVPPRMRAREEYQKAYLEALVGAEREQPVFHAVEAMGGCTYFTPISDFDFRSGYPFCRGTKVVLDNSRVTDADLPCLKKYDYLTHLSLRNTQVTDKGLIVLRDCRQLKEVDLTGTKTTNKGVADLRQALPVAEIIGANGKELESGRQ
jgi:hypothetical protein